MRVLNDHTLATAADRGAVLAIGNFDGVHRGHQAVLGAAMAAARAQGRPAGALLFDPHPRRYFQPTAPLFTLTPIPLRLRLLAALSLDLAVVLPFDRAMAERSAGAFIDDILVAGLNVAEVIVGYDFNFGRGRQGTPETLVAAGRERGFVVTVQPAVRAAPAAPVFSSSTIRTLLQAGRMGEAAQQLGYWWRVSGIVTGGAKRGTGLGFPTANIVIEADQSFRHGIYAARAWVDGERHDAAAYLGTRPTFDNGLPVLETFLLDFEGDLYGRSIDIELIAHLRNDAAFTTLDALKQQMALDCEAARLVLADALRCSEVDALPLARMLRTRMAI